MKISSFVLPLVSLVVMMPALAASPVSGLSANNTQNSSPAVRPGGGADGARFVIPASASSVDPDKKVGVLPSRHGEQAYYNVLGDLHRRIEVLKLKLQIHKLREGMKKGDKPAGVRPPSPMPQPHHMGMDSATIHEAPPKPTSNTDHASSASRPSQATLTAILVSGQMRQAIVNENGALRALSRGDTLDDGWRIVSVTDNAVTLSRNGKHATLHVKASAP